MNYVMLYKSNPWIRLKNLKRFCIYMPIYHMFLPFGKVLGLHTPTQEGGSMLVNSTKDGRS